MNRLLAFGALALAPLMAGASCGSAFCTINTSWDAHGAWLAESGELDRRRLARAREEVSAIAVAALRERLGALPGESQLEELAGHVASGELDPYTAADKLIGG